MKTINPTYYTPLGCGGKTLGFWQNFACGYYDKSGRVWPCLSLIDQDAMLINEEESKIQRNINFLIS